MPAIAKRPGIVTFVAVVLIVIGCLALLGGICGVGNWGLMTALPAPVGKPAPGDIFGNMFASDRFLADEVPAYAAVSIVGIFAAFGFGTAFLIAGLGCLRLNPARRKFAIMITLLYLLYIMASQAYGAIYVLPAQVTFQKQQQANLPPGAPDMSVFIQIGGPLALGCGIAFYITIAVLILVGLNTQSAKVAFGAAPPPADDRELRRGIREGDPRSKYEGYEEE